MRESSKRASLALYNAWMVLAIASSQAPPTLPRKDSLRQSPGPESGQWCRGLLPPPHPGEGERPGTGQRTECPDPVGAQCHHRVVVLPRPGAHAAVPQGQTRLGLRQGALVVPGPGARGARRLVQQQRGGVDLRLVQRQPVPGRRAHDQIGTQLRPQPRHQDLHRLAGPLRQLLRPQPLHQSTRAAAGAQILREQVRRQLGTVHLVGVGQEHLELVADRGDRAAQLVTRVGDEPLLPIP